MTASGIMILPPTGGRQRVPPEGRRAADRDPAGGESPVKRWSQPLSRSIALAIGEVVSNTIVNLDIRSNGDHLSAEMGGPEYVKWWSLFLCYQG